MYYFEIRFNTSNKVKAYSLIENVEKKLEIISSLKDDYYICYRLKQKVNPEILTEFKENKIIYFLTHYKL